MQILLFRATSRYLRPQPDCADAPAVEVGSGAFGYNSAGVPCIRQVRIEIRHQRRSGSLA